ncbi:hypothetical protein T266_15020 [Pseudomonas aeruginosa VRFPA05]|nr:hypothetical protein T266_15020 [Pseudomonas aeruginosa VRFPA05]
MRHRALGEERDHLADDDQRRRLQLVASRQRRQLGKGAAGHLLVRLGALADQRRRGVAGEAVLDQARGDLGEVAQAHVEHQGLFAARQAGPVEVEAAVVLQVAGDEGAGLGEVAVGQRDAGVGTATGGGGDARDHLAVDAGFEQALQLLGAATEDERVAALQADHPALLPGQAHQQLVDFFLRQAVVAAALADVDALAAFRQEGDQFAGDQAVVDHHLGLLQQGPGAQGEQARIAGAGADQGDAAGREIDIEEGRRNHGSVHEAFLRRRAARCARGRFPDR